MLRVVRRSGAVAGVYGTLSRVNRPSSVPSVRSSMSSPSTVRRRLACVIQLHSLDVGMPGQPRSVWGSRLAMKLPADN